ncbi:PD-(D/E)XK nuclease superfamily [Weizmannia phage Youna2]
MAIFENRIAIHTSDRKTFKRCRRKYWLSSRLCRGLQPKKPNNILWLGTGVHHALQFYYEGKDTLVGAFTKWADAEIKRIKKEYGAWDEELEALNQVVADGVQLLEHYNVWAKEVDNFEPFKMEVMFSLPITDPYGRPLIVEHPETGEDVPVMYEGRFDGIVKDEMGHYWILEHKTAKSFSDWDTKLPLDEQITSYIWAAEYLFDIPVEGVIYNGLRKKAPSIPPLLKNGKGLSKNKNIDTTYDVYLAEILKHGFDPADYKDILDILKAKGNKFFRREYVRRTPEEVQTVKEQIFYEACDMLEAEHMYPNPTRDCSWDCDFYEVCVMMQNKGDVEPILADMYEPRTAEEDEFEEKVGK